MSESSYGSIVFLLPGGAEGGGGRCFSQVLLAQGPEQRVDRGCRFCQGEGAFRLSSSPAMAAMLPNSSMFGSGVCIVVLRVANGRSWGGGRLLGAAGVAGKGGEYRGWAFVLGFGQLKHRVRGCPGQGVPARKAGQSCSGSARASSGM